MTKGFSDEIFGGGGRISKCADTHPMITLQGIKLCGGAASSPIHHDCDIYVSLQGGSTSGLSSDPWEEKKVVEIHYSITDGCAPRNVPRFLKMIDYLCNQLQEGKKVHVGCIGGHGRTGVVLAAIVARLGEKDAIRWVRKNYCSKAVESKEQVKFLAKYFDVESAGGSKEGLSFGHGHGFSGYSSGRYSSEPVFEDRPKTTFGGAPMPSHHSSRPEYEKPKPVSVAEIETFRKKQAEKQAPRPAGASKTITPMNTARSLFRKLKSKRA